MWMVILNNNNHKNTYKKQNTYKGKKTIILIYHSQTKGHIFLIYDTSIILLGLMVFPFQHGLLLWSPSRKSRYGHSGDNVCETVLVARLAWHFSFLSKILMFVL